MCTNIHLQARLRDKHQELLRKKLFFLKQQQLTQEGGSEDSPLFPGGSQVEEEESESDGERVKSKAKGAGPSGKDNLTKATDTLIDEDELLRGALEAYEAKGYSPRLIKHGDVDEVRGGEGGVCEGGVVVI